MKGAKDNAVHLVDASVYVFRAWFALPAGLTGRDGQPVNAVHGFAQFVCDLVERVRPGELAFAFDESLAGSHRNELYPAYKANREPAPPELKAQFRLCRELAEAAGFVTLASDRYEADDLIGTLAARAQAQDQPVVIVSRDKDLAQLLTPRDALWDFAGDTWLDARGVQRRFGVWPAQMLDFQALMGDAVDNVPGVRGIGAASAALLLRQFRDLDNLYACLPRVERLRRGPQLRRRLEEGRDAAYLSRELCRVLRDVPLPARADSLHWRGSDAAQLREVCARIGLGTRLSRRLLELSRDES
ncbi:MAG TPA: 5'-3' exonuclease H3TH domain-containing protein [Nevskiales bacterium]|nr:5'-3' exonuclease H3TH domain-containing protein [Nevskiales bacterium]